VSLFGGYLGVSAQNGFDADVYEYPGGVNAVASAHGVLAQKEHDWVRFPLVTVSEAKFVRGKQYEVRFRRSSAQDSLHFYFQRDNPYAYGLMIDPNQQPSPRVDEDLCLRLSGKARVTGAVGMFPDMPYLFWRIPRVIDATC